MNATTTRTGLARASALGAAALLLASCGAGDTNDAAEERTELRVGYDGYVELFSSFFAATELGEFEAEGLDVTTEFITTADALPLLETGDLDMLVGSLSAGTMNAIESGMEIRVVAQPVLRVGDVPDGIWARTDVIDDLPETIRFASAIGPGTSYITGLWDWLEEHDRTLDDVEFEAIAGPDITVALENDAVDAAFLQAPQWLMFEDDPAVELARLYTPDQLDSAMIAFGSNLLEGDEEVGIAAVRALARTVRDHLQGDYKEDDEVVEAIARGMDASPEDLRRYPSYEFDFAYELNTNAFERTQGLFLEIGGILNYDEPLAVDDVYDSRFRDAAVSVLDAG